MTVEENLTLGAYSVKRKDKIHENLRTVYDLFPRLKERSKQLAGTMSGGERQMLAIARGLMSNPCMIMLDEPSMGLSPQNVRVVFETIKMLREQGVTTLIVEQNVNTTLEFADRAYIIDQGRVVMEGTSSEVRADDRIRKLYLGEE
jgi:branched-chain amino acid transport system ATP-binding protein